MSKQKRSLNRAKKKYNTLENLHKMAQEDAAKAAIATQMRAADELTYVLGRWKIDLESAWEEFTEKDWR